MDYITDLRVFRYRLPLARSLNLGGETVEHREGLLVRLAAANGGVGWGEIAPLPGFSRETVDDAQAQIERLRGKEIDALLPSRVIDALANGNRVRLPPPGLPLAPSVRFGLEQALLWLQAAGKHLPVPALLRDRPPSAVPLNSLLIGDSVEELEDAASEAVVEGYRSIKLKVGRRSVDADVEAVRAVSRMMTGNTSLRLDANRAWTRAEASAFVKSVSDCPIEYLEEPLVDPAQLAAFAASTSIPIALDETLRAISAPDLSDYPFVKAAILKPTLMGGFTRSAEYIRAARRNSIAPVVSASFESGVGLLGLAWLAAGFDLDGTPAGLDTWRWLEEDLLVPRFQSEDGVFDELAASPADLTIDDRFLTPLS